MPIQLIVFNINFYDLVGLKVESRIEGAYFLCKGKEGMGDKGAHSLFFCTRVINEI